MAYMYAKCNQIPIDKFTMHDKVSKGNQQLLILDDASISGESIKSCYDDLNNLFLNNNLYFIDLYFFPLVYVYPSQILDNKINVIGNHNIQDATNVIEFNIKEKNIF